MDLRDGVLNAETAWEESTCAERKEVLVSREMMQRRGDGVGGASCTLETHLTDTEPAGVGCSACFARAPCPVRMCGPRVRVGWSLGAAVPSSVVCLRPLQ